MIATDKYSAQSGRYHALVLTSKNTITLHTSISDIYAIAFFAGLNTFQVDQLNGIIDSRTSSYTVST